MVASSADRPAVPIPYNYRIVATSVQQSYFGHAEFEQFAPGLKSLADAVAIQNRVLQAFELAEAEENPQRHRDLLTFVLVGAGPTGVEMAGALALLVRKTLRGEFRRIDPLMARVVLIDMAPRVLGSFAEKLSAAAKARLERLGVEVRLGHGVDRIDADGVVIAGERVPSKTVIWTAGVTASPAGKWLGAETDRAGRVDVQSDLPVSVFIQWVWTYLTGQRGSRLIVNVNHRECRNDALPQSDDMEQSRVNGRTELHPRLKSA